VRHRGRGQTLPLGIRAQGISLQLIVVVLNVHVRFDVGDRQSTALVKSSHVAVATDDAPPAGAHSPLLDTVHRRLGHASASYVPHGSCAKFGSTQLPLALSPSHRQPRAAHIADVANMGQAGFTHMSFTTEQPALGHAAADTLHSVGTLGAQKRLPAADVCHWQRRGGSCASHSPPAKMQGSARRLSSTHAVEPTAAHPLKLLHCPAGAPTHRLLAH
jgi:hypothetical protein